MFAYKNAFEKKNPFQTEQVYEWFLYTFKKKCSQYKWFYILKKDCNNHKNPFYDSYSTSEFVDCFKSDVPLTQLRDILFTLLSLHRVY